MTENEAYNTCFGKPYIVPIEEHEEAKEIIRQALEEIQQYRAIGTVERLLQLQHDYWYLNETCKEYSEIGTIEEFRALKENGFFNFDSPVARVDEKSYNKAIDEFARLAVEKLEDMGCEAWRRDIEQIAERLKGGAV